MTSFSDLRAGLGIDLALEAFRDGCNKGPDRLFLFEVDRARYEPKIRDAISGSITNEQATLLREVVEKRVSLHHFVEWVTRGPKMTWEQFGAVLHNDAEKERERAQRERIRRSLADYQEWRSGPKPIQTGDPSHPLFTPSWRIVRKSEGQIEAAKTNRSVPPCPVCATPSRDLHWRYAAYNGIYDMAGMAWKGWIITCEDCQVAAGRALDEQAIA